MTEAVPPRGVPLVVQPGIRRIVAPNPGPMTYHGTNTWLVDWAGGTVAIDPGSEDERHLAAILREAAGRLTHILVTHTHRDHLDGAQTLARRSGARTAGYRISGDASFAPAIRLDDGESIGGLTTLYTPGHAMDHLCFAHPQGILFSGDHVMGWSTSVVPPPPHGDLDLFIASLQRVRDRGDRLMLSAHGAAIDDPAGLVAALLEHRFAREASIAGTLDAAARSLETLLARAYVSLKPELLGAARANLLSHLIRLERHGRAVHTEAGWSLPP
ncbi:MBL fold metallo-hydrolase [Lichenicoccus sp.]|uniref:MBL fold metallo-hydrolase n=1 Tax=Lichenicoccus sp. TaxID=2781899 RepID=UPI003D11957F